MSKFIVFYSYIILYNFYSTLWNIGFDWLLRQPVLPGMGVICYADDTLLTFRGRTFREAARLATVGTEMVVDHINHLGLKVALPKTLALLFHGPRKGPKSWSMERS